MTHKRYIHAACEFNHAARILGLDELPLDLEVSPAVAEIFLGQLETAVRQLQRLLDDLGMATRTGGT